MNRRLAATVLAAFRQQHADGLRAQFAPFEERDWLRTAEWLHTSGMALYFLGRAKTLGIEDVMPVRMLRGLEQNHAENRVRSEDLFREFVTINAALQRAGVTYLNLKGFTLTPRACPDPTYRYQHDLDFLVCRRNAEQCRQAVERHGYRLTAVSGHTWEFRAGNAEAPTMRDLYKVRLQRSLEVHVIPEGEGQGGRLSRMQLQVWNGFEFPALSDCDALLAQAQHLFKHFQTEWTRTAWMLEYATAIRSHGTDEDFWRETVAAIEAAPERKVGIGLANLITRRAFGVEVPAGFRACTVDAVRGPLRLWVDRYQDEVVFTEHPGSKLYLLLRDVLLQGQPDWKDERRRKLFPSRLPPVTMPPARTEDVWLRARTAWARFCFVGSRLRFHVTEGLHYKVEAARWRRMVADLRA
jgi:hypothetical protein